MLSVNNVVVVVNAAKLDTPEFQFMLSVGGQFQLRVILVSRLLCILLGQFQILWFTGCIFYIKSFFVLVQPDDCLGVLFGLRIVYIIFGATVHAKQFIPIGVVKPANHSTAHLRVFVCVICI